MSFLEPILSFRSAKKARQLADDLANRLTDRVWQAAEAGACKLSLAQARGYLRAHANRIARHDLQGNGSELAPWLVAEAERLAAETMVIRCLQQLARRRESVESRQPLQRRAIAKAA